MNLRKLAILAAAAMFAAPAAYACDKCQQISSAAPAMLFSDVTALHHAVTTKS